MFLNCANNSYEHFTNVTFGDINNTSGASNYSNFTLFSTDVNQGQSYDLSVSYSDDYASDQVKIWIDFNGNGSFEDAGEEFSFPLASGVSSPFTQNITIPNDAKPGTTVMRLRLDDTNNGSNATSCGNSSYGEVEDYTINIVETLGIIENNFSYDLEVYPNPTDGNITIDFKEEIKTIKLSVVNILGQTVQKENFNNKQKVNFVLKSNNQGVYFIKIKTEKGNTAVVKILKNK